jgi:hypothetical protein
MYWSNEPSLAGPPRRTAIFSCSAFCVPPPLVAPPVGAVVGPVVAAVVADVVAPDVAVVAPDVPGPDFEQAAATKPATAIRASKRHRFTFASPFS